MAYDIHIIISEDQLHVSEETVSLDHRIHSSIMRFVYQSEHPVMFKLSDFLRDAYIRHDELQELKMEIASVRIEMSKKKSSTKDLDNLEHLIETALSMGMGIKTICD